MFEPRIKWHYDGICGAILPLLSYTFMEYTGITLRECGYRNHMLIRLRIGRPSNGGSIPCMGKGLSLFQSFKTLSAFHPASCLLDTKGSYPGVKRPVRQTYCSFPSSAEVKNEWSCVSSLQYAFVACTGTTSPLPVSSYHVWRGVHATSVACWLHLPLKLCGFAIGHIIKVDRLM